MQEPTRVDFSDNPMAEPDFKFYDKSLLDDVKRGDPNVHEFFRLLALCHTVMPEYKEGKYKVLLTRSYWLLSLGNSVHKYNYVFPNLGRATTNQPTTNNCSNLKLFEFFEPVFTWFWSKRNLFQARSSVSKIKIA